ncbi:MAG: HNH endonuclease [Egibacteraceae bacterium]
MYQNHVGRLLGPDEEVDHIDENKANDGIGNLQPLSKSENSRKARFSKTRAIHYVQCRCPSCGRQFHLTRSRMASGSHLPPDRRACSKSCAGKIGANKRWTQHAQTVRK